MEVRFLKKMETEDVESELKGVDVLVSTPLKFLKSLQKFKLKLSRVQFLVLDECDKYFELVRGWWLTRRAWCRRSTRSCGCSSGRAGRTCCCSARP